MSVQLRERLGERDIARVQDKAFRMQRTPKSYSDYCAGLYDRIDQLDDESTKLVLGYNSIFPLFEGDKLDGHLRRLSGNPSAKVLDIGCCTGHYLVDVRDVFALDGVGLTACHYPLENHPKVGSPSRRTLKRHGVQIVEGDIQQPPEILVPDSFGLVTAVRTAQYLGDPWSLVRQAHRLLEMNGTAFIAGFTPAIADIIQAEHMWEYLAKSYRFQVTNVQDIENCYELIFRKTTPTLELPLEPVGVKHFRNFSGLGPASQLRFQVTL